MTEGESPMDPVRKIKGTAVFKIPCIVFIMISLIFCFYCSRGSENKSAVPIPQRQQKPPRPIIHKPVITEVKIEPLEPTAHDFLRALPVLLNPKMAPRVDYHYQWFVNREIVLEGKGEKMLHKDQTLRGDTVYCRVRGTKGKLESTVVSSKKVTIGNALPVVGMNPANLERLPGNLIRYTIAARDPDSDPLTFRLISPLDKDISLDPQTGVLEINLNSLFKYRAPAYAAAAADESEDKPAASGSAEEEAAGSRDQRSSRNQRTGSRRSKPGAPKSPSFVKVVFEVRDTYDGVVESAITVRPPGRRY